MAKATPTGTTLQDQLDDARKKLAEAVREHVRTCDAVQAEIRKHDEAAEKARIDGQIRREETTSKKSAAEAEVARLEDLIRNQKEAA